MVLRASLLALLMLGLAGPSARAAGRVGPNFIPWDQAAQLARETGKPVACYSVIDINGGHGSDTTVNADWSINECEQLKEAREFIWTRCDNVKTARKLKPGTPPQLFILDCDMEKVSGSGISDLDSVEAALQGGLEKYSNREITWAEYSLDGITAATDKRFVVLGFTNEREDCTTTMKSFEDRSMVKHQARILFMQSPFVKDSEEAKAWGVSVSPAWLIIDANQKGKVIERLQGRHTPTEVRAFIAKGFKATTARKDLSKP